MDKEQIKDRLQKVDELNAQIKVAKEMLRDALDNDSVYQQTEEETKLARDKKKNLVNEIYNQPENRKIVDEIKATREEIATLKEILSEELIEYRNQHKTESIEGHDGQVRIFKFSVKLSPKPTDSKS